MGIAEAILDAVLLCPDDTRHHLLSNIVLCGGNALFPGIKERLYKDLRALAAEEHSVNVTVANNPISYAWHGGKVIGNSECFIKRQEFEEYGTKILDQPERTLTVF
jgi:actin-related protein 6